MIKIPRKKVNIECEGPAAVAMAFVRMAIKKHPTLTVEQALKMMGELGF